MLEERNTRQEMRADQARREGEHVQGFLTESIAALEQSSGAVKALLAWERLQGQEGSFDIMDTLTQRRLKGFKDSIGKHPDIVLYRTLRQTK